tara:strand:+ start:381 stop:731 length:351 start_codon:yes stop_codon:yes gene_type:complete
MSNLKIDDNSFFTISKTAKIIGVQSHVLRFWEKKFLIINPKKSLSGRRYYSSKDIENLLMIKKLLYEEGFTIKGAMNFIDKKNNESKNANENLKLKLIKALNLIKEGSNLIKKNLV